MNTLFSPPIHRAKVLPTGLKNVPMVIYIFSIWYKLIHFSLPLNPALYRMGTNPDSLCPRCKEREESYPHFIFHCRLSRITLDFINKLINLDYTFRTPFKISVKDILMATSSHTHDGVN